MSEGELKRIKVAIIGCRDLKHTQVYSITQELCGLDDIHVVTGDAHGVDGLARDYATQMKLPLTIFHADWNKHGKKAGPIRNKEVCDFADRMIAFWDGKSKGTKNAIKQMKQVGKKVKVMNI